MRGTSRPVVAALQSATTDGNVEAPQSCFALVAAEVVAALKGHPAPALPKEEANWIRSRRLPSRVIGLLLPLWLCMACAHGPTLMTPACSNPVPVTGRYDRNAPEFWTTIADRKVAADFARDFGLSLAFQGSTVLTFPVTIDPSLLARMRCDRRIEFISYSEFLKDVLAEAR